MTRGRTTRSAAMLVCLMSVLALSPGAAWARYGVVTTSEGRRFEGEITEKGNTVEVIMKGNIPVKLNRANVTIEYAASPAEQFKQQMAKLEKTDSAGHVELARWAMDRKEYDMAMEALDKAIEIDPNNEEAIEMRKVVQNQRRLNRQAAAAAGKDPKAAKPGETPSAPSEPAAAPADEQMPEDDRRQPRDGKAKKHRLVTNEEINQIRQLELRKGENVQIRLQNEVQRRYQQTSGFTPQEFAKLTPQQKGFEIINNGTRDMKKDVIVASDPASIAEFKSAVQRNVLPGCAASACHSVANPKAGDFVLHNPANKDAETYTNFLLMQAYKGTADGKDYAMVDRQRPENALVLMFGLPLDSSPLPHPKVQNFRPIFKGKSDPKYNAVADWMGKTLAAVPPEYDIDLTKEPGGDATTRPTRRRAAPREDAEGAAEPPAR